MVLGALLSMVSGLHQEVKPDKDLLVPVMESVFCCWPVMLQRMIVNIWDGKSENNAKQNGGESINLEHLEKQKQ